MNSTLIIILVLIAVLLYLYYNKKEHFSNQYGDLSGCRSLRFSDDGRTLSASCIKGYGRQARFFDSSKTCDSKKWKSVNGELECM
jgi:hypothetical protein